jgi:hypothetical protein
VEGPTKKGYTMNRTVSRLRQRLHIIAHPAKRRRVLATLALVNQDAVPPRLVGRGSWVVDRQDGTRGGAA